MVAEHLCETSNNAPKTVLVSLVPAKYVDRLEPDQPPLRFAMNEITLTYGPTGSGKRVLPYKKHSPA